MTVLGSYRNSPFVTGNNGGSDNVALKTENFVEMEDKWEELADYPFSNQEYVYIKI